MEYLAKYEGLRDVLEQTFTDGFLVGDFIGQPTYEEVLSRLERRINVSPKTPPQLQEDCPGSYYIFTTLSDGGVVLKQTRYSKRHSWAPDPVVGDERPWRADPYEHNTYVIHAAKSHVVYVCQLTLFGKESVEQGSRQAAMLANDPSTTEKRQQQLWEKYSNPETLQYDLEQAAEKALRKWNKEL